MWGFFVLIGQAAKTWDYYNESIRQGKILELQSLRGILLGTNKPKHTIISALDYQITGLKACVHLDIAPSIIDNASRVALFTKLIVSGLSKVLSLMNRYSVDRIPHYILS